MPEMFESGVPIGTIDFVLIDVASIDDVALPVASKPVEIFRGCHNDLGPGPPDSVSAGIAGTDVAQCLVLCLTRNEFSSRDLLANRAIPPSSRLVEIEPVPRLGR